MNRYTRKFKENSITETPLSELSDMEFAIVLHTGERLYPMDSRERAQSSINKLAQNLTPDQLEQAIKKLKMKYPGIQPEEKKW